MLRGWALAEQGQREEGIAQMRQGFAAYAGHRSEDGTPHFLALLAEAYGKAGQVEEGLQVLAEALAVSGQNWGAFLRGGAVSAQGNAYASVQGKSRTSQRQVQESQKSQASQRSRQVQKPIPRP